MQSVLN